MVIEYKIKFENGTLTVSQHVDLGTAGAKVSAQAIEGKTLPDTLHAAGLARPVTIQPAIGGDDIIPPPPPPGGGGPGQGGQVLVFGPVILDICGLIKKLATHTDSSAETKDE